jgi:hypothetical protein
MYLHHGLTSPLCLTLVPRLIAYSIPTVSLAEDFDPRAGSVAITVPSLVVGNYSIVLYGDSGNWSDEFEIFGGPTS